MEITKPNIRCWLLVVLLCANIPSRLSLENATIEHSKSLGLVQESRVLTWNENEESMKDDIVSLAKGKSGGRGTGGGNINHAPGKSEAQIGASHHMMILFAEGLNCAVIDVIHVSTC
nr:pentatricopeptide repeat-containing protein [Tanacetum cinerariifolium]